MRFFIFFISFLLWSSHLLNSQAQADEPIIDSYSLIEDNDYSNEDLLTEAEYVYQECTQNSIHRKYFDCGCISGSFALQREKLGPLISQEKILYDIYKHSPECANTSSIAGKSYNECQSYALIHRRYKKNNDSFCECVASEVARQFGKKPSLRSDYLIDIKTNGLVACTRAIENGTWPAQQKSAEITDADPEITEER